MRFFLVAALAISTLLLPSGPADARSRTEQTQAQSRTGSTQANRAAATRRPTAAPQASRASAARRSATPQRQAATRATTRQAATRGTTRQVANRSAGARSRQQASVACRGRNCGSAPRQVSWQSGLAPATNEQAQSCPVGTLATLARGHSDIVRCMPL